LGIEEPMVILKDGSYVLVGDEGVGKITMYNFMQDFSLVWMINEERRFAVMRRKDSLTPIDPAFDVLLTSVNK
jgi:hypothetical protein